jgi:membrane-associated phospholipid phosphatase
MAISAPARHPLISRLRRLADRYPRCYLGAHAIAGILLAIVLLWLFAAIADAVPENGRMVLLDRTITAWIQAHDTEWGETIFSWVSWIGAQGLVATVVLAAAWFLRRRERREAVALVVAAAGGGALNALLKLIFHRDRPEFAVEFITRHTYSFPSGHAMESMATFGMLAYLLLQDEQRPTQRRLLIAGTLLLVAAIGVSRVYLGVHYVSDVVGGYVAGAVWLLACIAGYREVRRRQRERSDDRLRGAATVRAPRVD